MKLVKDKASAKWWFWMWGLFAIVSLALVATALLWQRPPASSEVAAPAYTLVKVTTSTADEHSVAATLALMSKPEQKAALELHRPAITTALSGYLTQASGPALADSRNRAELLKALLDTANQALPPELKLESVLLTDFVVGS